MGVTLGLYTKSNISSILLASKGLVTNRGEADMPKLKMKLRKTDKGYKVALVGYREDPETLARFTLMVKDYDRTLSINKAVQKLVQQALDTYSLPGYIQKQAPEWMAEAEEAVPVDPRLARLQELEEERLKLAAEMEKDGIAAPAYTTATQPTGRYVAQEGQQGRPKQKQSRNSSLPELTLKRRS
jgi:hypothetical protein